MYRILAMSGVLVLAGVAPAMAFGLGFAWGPTRACFDPKSPPMRLTHVPQGTKSLDFVMHDLDAPDFHHGGGRVTYSGRNDIPYGAFRYKGPCPPSPHRYQFTVTARDATGSDLGEAHAMRVFPGK